MPRLVTPIALLIACAATAAGPYSPPASEYTTADTAVANATPASLASSLRNTLRTLTSSASQISYQGGRSLYRDIDFDLVTPGRIILVYNGANVNGTWDSGNTYNREHTWPRSHMINQSTGSLEYTDLHQLLPCNPSLNSSRGNEPFGVGSSSLWDPGAGSFDDQDRGEMARTMFYMATRYNYQLIECTNQNQLADGQMGDRSTLLEWHFEYPADERELYRNDYVDDNVQFNRNPFVDRNEYVWAIFGGTPNNSAITLDGLPATNGATSETIDLGDIILGAALPEFTRSITKTGTTPPTYTVRTTGDAITDQTDLSTGTPDDWRTRNLAFPFGPQAHTASIEGITLRADGSYGPLSGTVVIDNTDLTSAGPGLASDDGDDVITLNARLVDHSEASFSAFSDTDSTTIDFGVDATGATRTVTIWNLDAPSGQTADLRITGVSASGDASAFDLGNIPTLINLGGGNGSVNTITLLATQPGQYSATYTLSVADNPIPGGVAGAPLTLTVSGEVRPVNACVADMNNDGAVDLGDFGTFGAAFGSVTGDPTYNALADFNIDGAVDLGDFGSFGADFGRSDCLD